MTELHMTIKPSQRKSSEAVLRIVMLLSILAFLTYRLTVIGWADIWQAMPTSPLFYVLSLASFATPLIAEMSAFKAITKGKMKLPFKVFCRKHIFNKAVLSYSGEAYLTQRLSRLDKVEFRRAAILIKDLALFRTLAANLWVIILVLAAIIFGNADVLYKTALTSPGLVVTVSLICVMFCVAAVMFFKKITNISAALGARVTGIYLFRSLIVAIILTSQWSLAMPATSLSVWFIFLVIFSLTKKSPIGGELVFASVALTLPGLAADSSQIAAMLMSIIALNQLMYLCAFIATSDFGAFKYSKPSTVHTPLKTMAPVKTMAPAKTMAKSAAKISAKPAAKLPRPQVRPA